MGAVTAGETKVLFGAHLSIVHHSQRRSLAAHDADGHSVLQAAGHSAGCGLVGCGAGTHLTTVIVAPCVHLADRKLKVRRYKRHLDNC